MASRGEGKTLKSIAAPGVRSFLRKENVFTAKGKPGPHNKHDSVPLSFALTKLLDAAENLKEARILLVGEKVKVNGVARKKASFPVGLFDVVELTPMKKKFRAVLDRKGRLEFRGIDFGSKDFKVSKIVNKRAVKGGKILLTTNDGFTIEAGKEKAGVGDSVKISLPGRKVESVLHLKGGNIAYITGGTHVGEIIKIESVASGSLQRKKLVSLGEKDSSFLTVIRNVFVVGKEKPEIVVLREEK